MTSKQYETSIIEALKAKAKREKIAPLPEWISDEGESGGDVEFAATLSKSYLDYMRRHSTYGARGDMLMREGLQGSGYSRYLDRSALSERGVDIERATDAYKEREHMLREAYSDEIDSMNEEADRSYYDAISTITSMGITSLDEAYDEAKRLGFDDERARGIAERATTKLRFKLRSKVLNTIVAKHLNRKSAVSLALSLGLEYEDAIELGNNAREINEAHADAGVYPIVLIEKLKETERQKQLKEEEKLNEK